MASPAGTPVATPATKPSAPPSEELFVTGLPVDCTDDLVKQIFSQYGSVKDVKVLPVAAGKKARAAFVDMKSVEEAKWVVTHVHTNVPQGLSNPLEVTYATPRSQRGGGKGKGGGGKGMPAMMMQMMAMMMSSMGGGKGTGAWGAGGGGGGGGGGADPKNHDPTKYKTVLCRMFMGEGSCFRGADCTFAHGMHDLRAGGRGQ